MTYIQQISALIGKLRTDNETAAALNKNTNSSFLSVIKNQFASAFFRLHVDSGGCSGGKLLVAGVGEGIFADLRILTLV